LLFIYFEIKEECLSIEEKKIRNMQKGKQFMYKKEIIENR